MNYNLHKDHLFLMTRKVYVSIITVLDFMPFIVKVHLFYALRKNGFFPSELRCRMGSDSGRARITYGEKHFLCASSYNHHKIYLKLLASPYLTRILVSYYVRFWVLFI